MAIYKNITSNAETPLIARVSSTGSIAKGTKTANPGSIKSIAIANSHATINTLVNLYLSEGVTDYQIIQTVIPAQTTLVLDHNVAFDATKYTLNFKASATCEITIIIK